MQLETIFTTDFGDRIFALFKCHLPHEACEPVNVNMQYIENGRPVDARDVT